MLSELKLTKTKMPWAPFEHLKAKLKQDVTNSLIIKKVIV